MRMCIELREFIENYREAFGQNTQLTLLFGYSNVAVAMTAKIGGRFFKELQAAREGMPVALSAYIKRIVPLM